MNRPSRSRRLWALSGLAGTLLAAGVGCANNNSLIRGQSPDAVGVARAADRPAMPLYRAQSPDAAKPKHNTKLVSHEGNVVSSEVLSQGAVMGGGPAAYCPPGESYCPPGQPGFCMPGIPCPGIPVPGVFAGGNHYSYKDPGVPVYPAGTGPGLTGPGSPGAITQYPYYTTKGPDDFYLDQDGRF